MLRSGTADGFLGLLEPDWTQFTESNCSKSGWRVPKDWLTLVIDFCRVLLGPIYSSDNRRCPILTSLAYLSVITVAKFKKNDSLYALTLLCNTTQVNIIHDDYIRLHQNKSGYSLYACNPSSRTCMRTGAAHLLRPWPLKAARGSKGWFIRSTADSHTASLGVA